MFTVNLEIIIKYHAIITLALLCRLERAPTFLVPIINPPFADKTAGNYFWPEIVEKECVSLIMGR